MFKITEISPQQKGNLLNVFVNGEFSFSADSGFIVEEDVFVGKALDDQGLSDQIPPVRDDDRAAPIQHFLYGGGVIMNAVTVKLYFFHLFYLLTREGSGKGFP